MDYHTPVLLDEAIDLLEIEDGKTYVDCTLGGGGHFKKILEKLHTGLVIGIDLDQDAIEKVRKDLLQLGFVDQADEGKVIYFAKDELTICLCEANFSTIREIMHKICKKLLRSNLQAHGILFDVGVSSYQIDEVSKGFSYMHDGPLDMRMSKDMQVKAEDLLNGLYEKELAEILRVFGEEIFALQIARNVIRERKKERITTSKQLREVIKKSVPFYYKNPYAKTFQALRIAVNDEIKNLEIGLSVMGEILALHGRVVCISFHSLEDRVVKQAFKGNEQFEEVHTMIQPKEKEVNTNKRSRSAKLRVYEKIQG